MKLEEIMVKDVIRISPDDNTAGAAKRMREKRVGCLVVTIGQTIKGILTDRDLLNCLSEAHNPYQCRVSNHMTTPVIVEKPGEELLRAVEVMAQRRIKRLPVVIDGKIVGIVSFSDISRVMHEQAQSFWSTWVSITSLARAQALHCRSPENPASYH
ncbi:MAG: CBS domain-containing protein [Deltaproteobacteria bacterium]|nr:CBS domain-containing protein [Deltaproteobacteria bacterium]